MSQTVAKKTDPTFKCRSFVCLLGHYRVPNNLRPSRKDTVDSSHLFDVQRAPASGGLELFCVNIKNGLLSPNLHNCATTIDTIRLIFTFWSLKLSLRTALCMCVWLWFFLFCFSFLASRMLLTITMLCFVCCVCVVTYDHHNRYQLHERSSAL